MITAVDCTIIRFDLTKIIPEYFKYYSQCFAYFSDIEAACTGATRKRISRKNLGDIELPIGTIGNPTLVTVEPNFAIKNVALFKISRGQSGAFLKHYLDSGWVISKMVNEAKGTTQKFVGLGYLRDFPINVPPLATQIEVVEQLDQLAAETVRLEAIYQQKLGNLAELKQAILQKAFAGELTAQPEKALQEAAE